MWSPSPASRPPTGLRPKPSHARSVSSTASLGVGSPHRDRSPPRYGSSSASIDSKSFHSAFATKDDSSCDDTYVSMTSSKSKKKKDSLFEESPRVLRETTRATNTSARRSPSLPKKKDYTESTGILDKLKSDINSLDIIRQSSYAEGSVFSGSVFDFDDNESLASKRSIKTFPRVQSVDRLDDNESLASKRSVRTFPRAQSVDRPFRQERHDLRVDTLQIKRGGSSMSVDGFKHDELREKLHNEKVEMQTKTMMNRGRDMEMKLNQKDKEIIKLQETIRGLKREVVIEKEENEGFSIRLSDMKSELAKCRSKEEETQSALREVMKRVEHEREVRAKETQLAAKVQEAEVLMLEEKLDEALENIEDLKKEESARDNMHRGELSEKTCIIDGLKRDVNHLRSLLDTATRSKADSERMLRDKIERLELRLDEETEAHNKNIAKLNQVSESSEEELNRLEAKLEELESENEDLREIAESVEGFKLLERDYEDLKQSMESAKAASESATERLRSELEETHRAKTLLERQLASMKEMELERDEYVSKMERSLADGDCEKQELEKLQKEFEEAKSEHDKTIEALTASLEKAKEETVEANAQLKEAVSKLERCAREEQVLTKRVNELESENLDLASKLSTVEMEMEQNKEHHSNIVAESEAHLKDVTAAKGVLEDKIDEMTNEIQSCKDQLAKVPQLEATIKDLGSTLDQSKDKHTTLQLKLKKANDLFDESETKYEGLEKKYKSLKRELSEHQEREQSYTSGAKTRELELMDKIQGLKAEKSDAVAQIEELKKEAEKNKKELSHAKEESKCRNEQLRQALESLDEMMKYIDSMKQESDEMIQELESEAESLMKRIAMLERTAKQHNDEKTQLISDIKTECEGKMKDEIKRLTNSHSRELEGMRVRYEAQIKDLESTMNVTRSLQEQGSSEVGSLIKKLGEVTERHSKDLRATREKYETAIDELKAVNRRLESGESETLRDLESKNKKLENALKAATAESAAMSLTTTCNKCDSIRQSLQEKEQSFDELKTKLQDQIKSEMKLRGELAQSKQLMTITQANEKLLEEHVASLEAQIDALVNDYETKLSDV